MKSKYFLATLVWGILSNTNVCAAEHESSRGKYDFTMHRLAILADQFEARFYRGEEKKDKSRRKAQELDWKTAERKAALVALRNKKKRGVKSVEFQLTKPDSPTSPKTPVSKVENAKAVSPKKTEVIKPSE